MLWPKDHKAEQIAAKEEKGKDKKGKDKKQGKDAKAKAKGKKGKGKEEVVEEEVWPGFATGLSSAVCRSSVPDVVVSHGAGKYDGSCRRPI